MKKILLTTLLTILVVPVTSFAASFDCTKAASLTEKLICGDESISKLDEQLAASYKVALDKATDKDAFKKTQIEWLKQQRACKDTTCLTQSYETRLDGLKNNVAIKSKLETVKTPQYKLLPFKENKSLAETNGVCEAFLEILNTTPYEQLYNDIFLNVLKDKKDFEPLKWRKVEDGESQFGKIIEEKIAYDSKPDFKESRIKGIKSLKERMGGFDYYLSEIVAFQNFYDKKILPILFFSSSNADKIDKRKYFSTIFLDENERSFYKMEPNNQVEYSLLTSLNLFYFKDRAYVLDLRFVNNVNLVALHAPINSSCAYKLNREK